MPRSEIVPRSIWKSTDELRRDQAGSENNFTVVSFLDPCPDFVVPKTPDRALKFFHEELV
jgi:hypothetical protein